MPGLSRNCVPAGDVERKGRPVDFSQAYPSYSAAGHPLSLSPRVCFSYVAGGGGGGGGNGGGVGGGRRRKLVQSVVEEGEERPGRAALLTPTTALTHCASAERERERWAEPLVNDARARAEPAPPTSCPPDVLGTSQSSLAPCAALPTRCAGGVWREVCRWWWCSDVRS